MVGQGRVRGDKASEGQKISERGVQRLCKSFSRNLYFSL